MFACLDSATLSGIDAVLVRVEVDVATGVPNYRIVGLPDASAAEAKERVSAALRNSGFGIPSRRVTINLAPGEMRKEGPRFDLAIALGVAATLDEDFRLHRLRNLLVLGEVALDGALRPVRGVLSSVMAARRAGISRVLLPRANGPEAALVEGVEVLAVADLRQAWEVVCGRDQPGPVVPPAPCAEPPGVDLACVRGQHQARRALEIAAAGGHHLLMVGSPGGGKTLLARCLPGILPPLSEEEALEVTRIHSAHRSLSPRHGLVRRAPFRSPACGVSVVGLLGGHLPGEVSLAHRGVLFLDEFPEFRRDCLEGLRTPLEDGEVHVARASFRAAYPTRFTLVAAMNPCPCGFHGDPGRQCTCSPDRRLRYVNRLSGPIRDRIDLQVWVPRSEPEELMGAAPGEPSEVVRERVLRARALQRERGRLNAQLDPEATRRVCACSSGASRLLGHALRRFGLSARVHDRLLRLARTAADLAGRERVEEEHLAEALDYRYLDRSAVA